MQSITYAPVTYTPAVRDDTAPDISKDGLASANLIDPPAISCPSNPINPATSHLLGSITYDREHDFNLEWNSIEAFKEWLDNEQTAKGIELRPLKIECGSTLYTTNQIFHCMHNRMGGLKLYQKKTV